MGLLFKIRVINIFVGFGVMAGEDYWGSEIKTSTTKCNAIRVASDFTTTLVLRNCNVKLSYFCEIPI